MEYFDINTLYLYKISNIKENQHKTKMKKLKGRRKQRNMAKFSRRANRKVKGGN